MNKIYDDLANECSTSKGVKKGPKSIDAFNAENTIRKKESTGKPRKQKRSARDRNSSAPTKRSRKQDVDDFFALELPRDVAIDTDFVSSMTLQELRTDVDALDEYIDPEDRPIPLSAYPREVKEEFWLNMDKLADTVDDFQDRLRSKLMEGNSADSVEAPIMLPTGHNHGDVKLPVKWDVILKKDPETAKYCLLTPNEEFHLFQSKKHESFENYIAPKILNQSMDPSQKAFFGTINQLDDIMYSVLSNRIDGVERLDKWRTKIAEDETYFALTYPAHQKALFFVAIIVKRIGKVPKEIKQKKYVRTKWAVGEDKSKNSVLTMKVEYVSHLYFPCECREIKTK